MRSVEMAKAWGALEEAVEEAIAERVAQANVEWLNDRPYDAAADRELARRIVRMTRAMADVESGAADERRQNAANDRKRKAILRKPKTH